MQRDWDLVRRILLEVEALGDAHGMLFPGALPPYDAQIVGHHLRLLAQAGLLEVHASNALGGDDALVIAKRLTWQGYDLLDSIREQGAWNRVRAIIREKGLDISIEVIKLAAQVVTRQAFGG